MCFRQINASEIPDDHPVSAYLRYFDAHKNNFGTMPRADFDPIDVPRIMPWMMIFDEMGDQVPPVFKHRLVGTACCELFGADHTGILLSDVMSPEENQRRSDEFVSVKNSLKPSFSFANVPFAGKEYKEIFRGVFPVVPEGETQVRQFHVIVAPTAQKIRC